MTIYVPTTISTPDFEEMFLMSNFAKDLETLNYIASLEQF